MKNAWQSKRLGEVAAVFDGPHATPRTVSSGPIFLGISALQEGVIDLEETRHVTDEDFQKWTRRVKPRTDDVVFSYETRLGQAAIIPEGLECCLGRRMGLVRFHEGAVLPRFFLYQYLSPSFRHFLDDKTIHGATVDRISIREFPSFPIAVPPIVEQQRIVGILDEAFHGIATAKANAEKNLQNARGLFESHLEAVFTQRGHRWKDKLLGEIASFRNGINYTQASKGEQVRIVGVRNFRANFTAPLDDLDTVTLDGYLSETDTLKRNDILVVRSNGNIELIGRCMLVGDVNEKISHSGFTIRVRFETGDLSPRYLCHFMKSAATRKRFTDDGTGTNIKSLNQGTLASLRVPFPPLHEQTKLVERLERISEETQRLESIYQQKLATLDSLKKSLLHEAFSGNL